MANEPKTGNGKDPKKGTETNSGKPPKKAHLLGAAQMIDQLKRDCCDVIDDVVATVITGVQETDGSERASITITASFNPGGARSKARFEVSGKATIPAKGACHEMVITEKHGEKQLQMYGRPGA